MLLHSLQLNKYFRVCAIRIGSSFLAEVDTEVEMLS